MIKATLRSPAAEATAQRAVTQVAAPATQPAPSAAVQPQLRAAAASRVPAGVITPRGGTTAPAVAPKPPATVAAARIAPRLQSATAPAAATPARPVQPAQPVPAAAVPVQAVLVAPVPGSPAAVAAAKPRRPRTPKAPVEPVVTAAPEVITETVPTPVEGVEIETVTTINAGAPESVDQQLFGEPEAAPLEAVPVEEYPTDPEEQVAEPQAVAQTAALAVRPPAGLPARTSYGDEGSGIEGDWGTEDLRFPQLKVVQGSGQLSALFDNGAVIFADNLLFNPASVAPGAVNPLLYFVPLSVKKQWRENLTKEEQAAGQLPRVVDTIDEVEDLGGSTLWIGNQKPGWSPSARCLFLLEQPEGSDHPNFTTQLDGRNYGVAVYYAGGTAFNLSAKVIFNTGLTSLQVPVLDANNQPQKDPQGRAIKRTMLYKNFWTINWTKKPSGEYTVWQPTVRILAKEETGPEVRSYVETLLQSRQNFNVATEEP